MGTANCATLEIKLRSAKMNSSFSFSSTTSSSYESDRCMRATSEVSDQYYASIGTDIGRLEREFYSPAPISKTGNYYPRFRTLALQRLVAATCPIWPDLSTSTMSPVDMASANMLLLGSSKLSVYSTKLYFQSIICFSTPCSNNQ